jgi:hypothetical protein
MQRLEKLKNGYKAWRAFSNKDGMISNQCSLQQKKVGSDHSLRAVASRPPKQYEFPTGYNTYFYSDRFHVGEQLFFHTPQLIVSDSVILECF